MRWNSFFGIWAIFSSQSSFSVRPPNFLVINVLNASKMALMVIALWSPRSSNLFDLTCIPTTFNCSFNRWKPQLSSSVSKLYSMTSPITLLILPFQSLDFYWGIGRLTSSFSIGISDVKRSYFVRENTFRAVGLNYITVTLNLCTGDVHNHFTQSGVKFWMPVVLSSNTRYTSVISFTLEISRKLVMKRVRNIPSGYSQPY